MNDTRRIPVPKDGVGRFGRGPRAWLLRLASSPRFQGFAARNPLLARKARREGEAIFDLIAGFVKSQVLFALVDMDVLTRLSHGPCGAEEAAPGLPAKNARLLMDAACATGLVSKGRAGYRLTTRGAAFLAVPGGQALVRHHAIFYRDMTDPSALLRGEAAPELARFWPYVFGAGAAEDPDQARAYSDLMADTQRLVADDTLRMVDLSGALEVLDVGGGTGAFLTALGQACHEPRLHLFDLPAVAPGAESRFRAAGLSQRARITRGSFRDDPLPTGADVITLVRVLYDHDDETVRALLEKARSALPKGGRIVISEPMTGGAQPHVPGDVYFAFYTLCMETGQARSQARIAELLAGAGFERIETPPARRAFVTSVVTAFRR
ncbi:MAG: methyltransferase [Pseudomonadota bacterium]